MKHDSGAIQWAFVKSHQHCELLLKERTKFIDAVVVSTRMRREAYVTDFPSKKLVKKWLQQQRNATRVAPADGHVTLPSASVLYDLPLGTPEFQTARKFAGGLTEARDAVQILRYLRFTKHLKKLGDADETMVDAISAACPDNATHLHVIDNLPDNPKRTALYHARLQLDAVGMCIERRVLGDIIRNKKSEVASIHLHSDGSPVTGSELQGMVLTIIMVDRRVLVFVMPGVMLHFGGCRVIDKVTAFLWSSTL